MVRPEIRHGAFGWPCGVRVYDFWVKCAGFEWILAKRGKGTRGMPWRRQAMKDVASCEKPWGGARFL
jgi:hypothetical protein